MQPVIFYHQEFSATLTTLAQQVMAADSATLLDWLRIGYVIFGTVCFGIFPLVSLLIAALTVLALPILSLGRGKDRIRAMLGLSDAQIPRDRAGIDHFLETVRGQLSQSLILLLLVGLVPFLGVAVGVIYYRLSPVARLAKVIEPTDLGPLRWVLPLAALTLVALQPMPVVGPLSMPLLYATYHGVYDTVLRRRPGSREALPVMA